MSLTQFHVLRWFTTPQELRRIADDMERRWPTLRPGNTTLIEAIVDYGTVLEIAADQEKMEPKP